MPEYNELFALSELNYVLAQLFGFARARDEVDFAFSLGPEFRGSQDAGWNTAHEAMAAFREGLEILNGKNQDSASTRNLLYRYLCIAEAGGSYEVLGNQLSILGSDIYRLTPFLNIVERHKPTGKIKAPNANRTFRELSERAERVGMVRLARALATAFDDELRNAIAHADFVIWQDGFRLRKRNGGYPYKLSWKELSYIVRRGFCFVDCCCSLLITLCFNIARTTRSLDVAVRTKFRFFICSNMMLALASFRFRPTRPVR